MKNRKFKSYFVIFFCLSSILFFEPLFINKSLIYNTYNGLFVLAFLLVVVKYKRVDNNAFTIPMFLLLIAILISAFSATFFWSQHIIKSFLALFTYLSYILFFLIIIFKLPVREIERIIIIIGVLYILVYAISFFSYPIRLFGYGAEYSDERGFQRIILRGVGFVSLLSFYSLSQYFKKRQFWWLIIYFVTVISIIMLLTRTLIAGSFIFWTLYILRKSSFIKKIIAILFIGGFVYFITERDFFQIMVEHTINQSKNINNDIRIQSAHFYINDFSPNILTQIFGNGTPYKGTKYANYVYYHLQSGLNYYLTDIGYVGFYVKFGLLAILAYIMFICRAIKISVPEEYLYCKYFLYTVFVISIIIDAPFNTSYIPPIVLATYVLASEDLSRCNNNKT